MSTPAAKPATTPIPVQLSATEFATFIFPPYGLDHRVGHFRPLRIIA